MLGNLTPHHPTGRLTGPRVFPRTCPFCGVSYMAANTDRHSVRCALKTPAERVVWFMKQVKMDKPVSITEAAWEALTTAWVCLWCQLPLVGHGITALFCNHGHALKHWHHTATKEGRCHSCGDPSTVMYKNACSKHIGNIQVINRRSQAKRLLHKRAIGQCLACVQPAEYGYTHCPSCRAKGKKASWRRRIEAQDERLTGLMSTAEIARAANVSVATIHWWVKRGRLVVAHRRGTTRPNLFFKEKEALNFVKAYLN